MHRKILELGVVGGLAFWGANFAISLTPLAADYRVGLSISYGPMILESLVGGLVIGCGVSFAMFRLADEMPTTHPILRSVVLSHVALVGIEAFSALLAPGHPLIYFLIGAELNIPRFLALGLVVGYLYSKTHYHVESTWEARARPSDS